ncbi:MAG: amidohydrolase family protein [Desulfobacteraceae bacterium]|nr:amidohydrolase family protein [Desulfobacteraceae bacterium]
MNMPFSNRHLITRELAAVAMGTLPADLILKNANLVDVCTGRIRPGCDLAVYKGIIACVGSCRHIRTDTDTKIKDVTGKYLCPGLIDSHMHVESSMVDLPAFAQGVLPHGTTTICPDIHEITNVVGMAALQLFKESAEGLPLKVLTAMPVCVPSLPEMEDAGAVIGPNEVAAAYDRGLAFLQGEQMNFPGVIYGDATVHEITGHGLRAGKVLTGHFGGDDASGLNAYVASGMTSDHETTTAEGALARAELGMYVQMRYGSAWLDLPNLMPAITKNPGIDTRFFTLVTDDVTPATISREGHLVRVVREAVRLGLDPVTALQMATINPAQMLEQGRWIGSLTPGRAADILVVGSLSGFEIEQVYTDGILVAEHGHMAVDIPGCRYPDWAVNTVHLDPLSEPDFKIACSANPKVTALVIQLIPGSVNTLSRTETMPVTKGEIQADPQKDIAKAAMFFRHKPGNGADNTRSLGLVSGTGFKTGSAYASTVSHDCHNLLVVGTNDGAMSLAANTLIDSKGGIAVVDSGRVLAHLALPLGGLMGFASMETAAEKVRDIEAAMQQIGCPHPAFEMTMSLIGLVVLGELRLSNRGLVEMKDGNPPQLVDLFVS